ncbi:alpha/beta hydrolase [Arthrobacter sp. OAP107]|uniref:alpha/beta fold hydrolase n=1 Tax=Arthrobacter sp. OAP107 TaxID=3156445 RepID=UPI003390C262
MTSQLDLRSVYAKRYGAPTPPSPAPAGSRGSQIQGLQHGLVPVDEGVRIHYVVAGEGEPVVLIPGWPQSWYAWRHVIPLLVERGRKVYAIDPRGFGDSDIPSEGYDMATTARDVHVFLHQLGLVGAEGIDIVSHDVGTWIGFTHAIEYPADVKRFVASDAHIPGISPLPVGDYPAMEGVNRQWHFYFNRLDGLPEALIHGREREFLGWFFGPSKLARTWAIDDDAFEEYLRVFSKVGAARAGLMYYREIFSPAGRAASLERSKKKLPMPVLTLGGGYADRDNLFNTMQQFSSDVTNHIFEGIGHHIPEEAPEEFVEQILKFWAA